MAQLMVTVGLFDQVPAMWSVLARPPTGPGDAASTVAAGPANGFQPATTTCVRTSNGGACDATDSCDGAGNCVDGFQSAITTCRPSAGQCDVAESCTGTGSACPVDGFEPGGTTCTDDGNACTNDVCTGTSATCTHPSNNLCNMQITPTATTCSQFVSGTSANLDQGTYLVKGTSITSVSPGVMFYYTHITAPSSSFTITINEAVAPNSTCSFPNGLSLVPRASRRPTCTVPPVETGHLQILTTRRPGR